MNKKNVDRKNVNDNDTSLDATNFIINMLCFRAKLYFLRNLSAFTVNKNEEIFNDPVNRLFDDRNGRSTSGALQAVERGESNADGHYKIAGR